MSHQSPRENQATATKVRGWRHQSPRPTRKQLGRRSFCATRVRTIPVEKFGWPPIPSVALLRPVRLERNPQQLVKLHIVLGGVGLERAAEARGDAKVERDDLLAGAGFLGGALSVPPWGRRRPGGARRRIRGRGCTALDRD